MRYGVIDAPNGLARFVIEQGVDIGRPSRIEAELEATGREVTAVRVGGASVEVLRGEISL